MKLDLHTKIVILLICIFTLTSAQITTVCKNCATGSCSNGNCTKCSPGFRQVYSNQTRKNTCTACTGFNCETCSEYSGSGCIGCQLGYRKNSVVVGIVFYSCTSCEVFCNRCDASKCLECSQGYVLRGSSCFLATSPNTLADGTTSPSVSSTKKSSSSTGAIVGGIVGAIALIAIICIIIKCSKKPQMNTNAQVSTPQLNLMPKYQPPMPSQNFSNNQMGQFQQLPPPHPGSGFQAPMGMQQGTFQPQQFGGQMQMGGGFTPQMFPGQGQQQMVNGNRF